MLWVNIFTKKIEVNLVTASKITQAETSAVLTSSGYVVAQRKASVASKATGRLIYLRVVEGGPVKKNQIIARIEDEDVKALLQLAKANLSLKKAELPDTKNKYERQKILYEKNLGTKSNFESFKKAFDSEKKLKQFEPKIEQKVFAICKDKIMDREELIRVSTIHGTQSELEQKCIDKCKELYNQSGIQYNPLQKFGSEEFSCLCQGSSDPCR